MSLHPDFPQARHARDGRVRLRLEQVEPAEPDLSPPLPLHELAGALVAHFNECLIDPGRVGILAKLPVLELQTALPQLHEVTRHWVSWCNRARINAGGAAAQADKILRLMASLVEVVADQGDALPGFASRIGEVQALAQAVRDHQTLVRDMPGYIASVWPSDGSWDRRPPTVAEVLLLMKTPGQDPTLVKARLADGQRPVDIAGQPSSVGLHEMEELCRQLAEQLQRADLALPLDDQIDWNLDTLMDDEALQATTRAAGLHEERLRRLALSDAAATTAWNTALAQARESLAALGEQLQHLARARPDRPGVLLMIGRLQEQVGEEQAGLQRLGAFMDRLRHRLAPASLTTLRLEELLPLVQQSDLQPDYLVQGLLAGWKPHEVLLAHQQHLPGWAMTLAIHLGRRLRTDPSQSG